MLIACFHIVIPVASVYQALLLLTFVVSRVSVLSQVCSRSCSPDNRCKSTTHKFKKKKKTSTHRRSTTAQKTQTWGPWHQETANQNVVLTMTTLTCYNSGPKMATSTLYVQLKVSSCSHSLSNPTGDGRLLTQSSRHSTSLRHMGAFLKLILSAN